MQSTDFFEEGMKTQGGRGRKPAEGGGALEEVLQEVNMKVPHIHL
jgi:hypothetical protein